MIRKTLGIVALALGVAAMGVNVAHAHGGAKPKHGGIVQMASDLSFELVAQPEGAMIYVEDHGKPFDPAGMTGKLTSLSRKGKSVADLAVSEGRLEARGITLSSGDKVVAVLKTATKRAITVRFTVK
ncbi:MAG: hypothetical protein ACLGHE_06160 [Gammaproteobacteria bacterium]